MNPGKRPNKNDLMEQLQLQQQVVTAIKPALIYGLWLAIMVVGGFIVWSGLAPLDSAVIANGEVVLNANRKTIQHLEGGIIKAILVKDGDLVANQQPLVELNATSANSQLALYQGQLRTAFAVKARLLAERDGSELPDFSAPLLQPPDSPDIAALIDSQTRLFHAKQTALTGELEVLQERINEYNEQIKGLQGQETQIKKQIQLFARDIHAVETLLVKGFEQKPHLFELQRREADLKAEQSKELAEIARIKGSIAETQLQKINTRSQYNKEVESELKETQQTINDLQEKLQTAQDVVTRTVIVAPLAGKVTGLKFHTLGGVISPGTPIMDIVPQNDQLIVEVQVRPQDIDIVHEGLQAKVMLTAYKSRFVPRISGTVSYVSADSFHDQNTGQSHYMARIMLDTHELSRLGEQIKLYPGMPTQAFIKTGERTLLQYLASPLIDSFRRAFKEQ